MKTRVLLVGALLVCALSWSSLGQIKFVLRTRNANPAVLFAAPVFGAYGDLLSDTNYVAELYGGGSPEQLQPGLADGSFRFIVPLTIPGYFVDYSQEIAVHTIPGTDDAWLQVKVWDMRLGATYETVAARGLGGYGESPLFVARGPSSTDYKALPAPLLGLQSFQIHRATAVMIRGVKQEGANVILECYPGFPRYQLRQAAAISGPWRDLGAPTTNLTATVAPTDGARFFRVIGLLE
jgi:hypothetical protein